MSHIPLPKIILPPFNHSYFCSQRENAIEESQKRLYISIDFDELLLAPPFSNELETVDCSLPSCFYESVIAVNSVNDCQKAKLCKRFKVCDPAIACLRSIFVCLTATKLLSEELRLVQTLAVSFG